MADNQQTVSIVIDTQRRNASAIDQTNNSLKALERTAKGVSDSTKAATFSTGEFTNILSLVPGPAGRAASSVASYSSSLTQLGTSIGPIGAAIAGVTLALTAAGTAAFAAAKSASDYQEKMDLMADRTGLTTSELKGLEEAAIAQGKSLEEILPSLDFFTRKLGEAQRGNKDAINSFLALGVTLKDASGEFRPIGDVLDEVGGKLNRIEDTALRNALAFDVFGRSSARTLSVFSTSIDDMVAAANQRGSILSPETEGTLRRLDGALDSITASINALKLQVIALIAVNIEPWVSRFNALLKEANEFARSPMGQIILSSTKTALVGRSSVSVGASESAGVGGGFAAVREHEARLNPFTPNQIPEAVKKGAKEGILEALGPSSEEFFARQRNPFLDQRSTELMQFRRGDIPGTEVSVTFSEAEEASLAYKQAMEDATGATLKGATATDRFGDAIGDTLASSFAGFIGGAIRGVGNLGAAFQNMVLDVLSSIASKGILSVLGAAFPFLQQGGTIGPPLQAQSGMLLSGIRGADTVPILAGRGETIISHALTDQLSGFLMEARRGQPQRQAAPVSVSLHFSAAVLDRKQLRTWVDEDIVPVLRRSVSTGSARAY